MAAPKGNKNALGMKHSDATKLIISEKGKGHPAYPNQVKATIEENKRRAGKPRKPFSEEHCKRLGERQRELWANPEWRAKRTKQLRDDFEQPEAMEKMRQGVKAHWETLGHEERMVRILPGLTASLIANPTSIEVSVRQALDALEIVFEEQKQIGPYFVDFVLSEVKVALEVMGCFWHGCLQCGHDTEKDKKARLKDKRRDAYLQKCGYRVHHIWEHDIKRGVIDILDIF